MNKLFLLVVMVLSGCGAPASVVCTGTRPMTCDCVESCVSTKEQVLVYGATCKPLCYVP